MLKTWLLKEGKDIQLSFWLPGQHTAAYFVNQLFLRSNFKETLASCFSSSPIVCTGKFNFCARYARCARVWLNYITWRQKKLPPIPSSQKLWRLWPLPPPGKSALRSVHRCILGGADAICWSENGGVPWFRFHHPLLKPYAIHGIFSISTAAGVLPPSTP